MAQVSLTVNGRVFRMECEDGQEDHVGRLGARFNAAIDELRATLGEIGDQRLTVMAGILMADRLDDAERRLRRIESDARDLKEGRLDAASRYDGLEQRFAHSLNAVAERVESVTRLIAPDAPPTGASDGRAGMTTGGKPGDRAG